MAHFFSDNAAAVCPQVMAAIVDANTADLAYDDDALSQQLNTAFSELFETDVAALWVSTGTAANALALAALCPPHGSVICHRNAHIQNDECGAPEFFTYGAKLLLADGDGAKLSTDAVSATLASISKGVHWAQPHALSVSNATEYGQVYTPDELAALSALAKGHGLGVHMDGARFANAIAHLGCSPAELSWKSGVDVLSFGCVKNGGMSAEALIFFRPELAAKTRFRHKRAGHLLSKGRYSAAQILRLLKGDLWLKNAHTANAGALIVGQAAGNRLLHPVEANAIFIRLNSQEAADLRAQGFGFYDWAQDEARFIVAYDQPAHEIEALSAALKRL